MYIEKLTIKNFRAFDEDGITLQFNKGVNAIIGENNSGKSTVMDAIRIAFSTVTYKKDIFFTRADFHVSEDGNAAEFALFDIYLEEVPTRLVEIWNPESAGGQGGEFHIRFERVIVANGIEKVRAIHWGIGTEGNPLSSDTFDAMDVMFLGALRDSESEMKPARNSKLAQLLRSLVPDEGTRAELVDILNSANNTLLEKEELKKTRKTINDNLARIEQDFLSQHVDIGLIEPRFDSIASSLRAWVKPKWILVSISDGEYSRAQQYAREHEDNRKIQQNENGIYFETSILENVEDMAPELVTRINEIASSSFELYQNGLGYNNLLFMSAVLGDMAIERGGVYQHLLLIEEPEAHLHPQLQELVHTFLTDTNQGDANIQIIFTSHSPTLASKVDIGNINLVYENAHKKYCLPFSEANLTDDNKEYLQKYLDVTKSQMFFAKGIIFVEGISEAILLPEIAKTLDRPLEKYAVELVNVDSVAFGPFVNLFSSQSVQTCFSKVAIVTDDDRCTKKSEANYINKDFDYDDVNSDISNKLLSGTPSERCNELETSCRTVGINVFKATKTLEYALCCDENNIEYFIEAIKSEYSQLGPALEQKVNRLHDMNEKAACVWLFIRARDKCKGAIAQYISQIIKKQYEMRKKGENIEKEFVIPDYLKEAVYCVTER
ncbi:ATP-dependent nuclease [Bovifimicola ammoniilytica]|uniref:ATP-dependent nuclease n=1 Tax=Bovifimicola ammoniilytica TaxID=2981720 RepID=UPI000820626A|nr:AAA family ATPase [Bovifimicola ammoniilytica]MCU6752816.1 AAA family ATPase [Bovifimicola ammoniilytica]SCJ42103.1 chromosome segregation protein [uncultured Eubacterium sp.]